MAGCMLRSLALVALAACLLAPHVAVVSGGSPDEPVVTAESADGERLKMNVLTEEKFLQNEAERAEKMRALAAKGDIHAAASTNIPAIIQMALDAGADINARGYNQQTPLMRSSVKGWDESARFLLEKGADTTLADRDGYTPLHGAAFTGKHKIIRHLLAAGLDPLDRHKDLSTPLHRACWGSTLDHFESVKVLVEVGGVPFDLPGVDDDGKAATPLEQVRANALTKKYLRKLTKRAEKHAAEALAALEEQRAASGSAAHVGSSAEVEAEAGAEAEAAAEAEATAEAAAEAASAAETAAEL